MPQEIVTLSPEVRELLDGKNFATVATLGQGGDPQTSLIWIARKGDAVLFTTSTGRQKYRNLARDPRVSITVFDLANPYVSVDIRGTAELIEDPDRSLSFTLSHKYLGEDPPSDPEGVRRLIVRVTPRKITGFAK